MKKIIMKRPEFITHYKSNPHAWRCICGNNGDDYGYYPCNKKGNEVEPTVKDWTTKWYICGNCGRMIDRDTLEVVGRNPHPKLLA
jgi:hypothetical protein